MQEINTAPDIRGHSTATRKADASARAGSWAIDFSLLLSLIALIAHQTGLPPTRIGTFSLACLAGIAALWALRRTRPPRSLGIWAWQLERAADPLHPGRRQWVQAEKPPMEARVAGIFLTLFLAIGSFFVVNRAWLAQPLLGQASPLQLEPFLPALETVTPEAWVIAPAYYVLGAFPAAFKGVPASFAVPYEKGPPLRFVGHIQETWPAAGVELTWEGPQTPGEYASGELHREDLRGCLLDSLNLGPSTLLCLRAREATLLRPIREIEAHASAVSRLALTWEIRWFRLDNPAIPADECAQGVYLRAHNGGFTEDRAILITPKGTHQSLSLLSHPGTEGEEARKMFLSLLGSLRVSDELGTGKAWIDHQLESIQLDAIPRDPPDEFQRKMAQVELLLVSKISVDPSAFDAFYHLAGLQKILLSLNAQGDRKLLQNLARFAKDIAPADPRSSQIDSPNP